MPWLLAGATALGVYFFGKSQSEGVQPDPIASLTNLVLVGGVVYVGYKLLKK